MSGRRKRFTLIELLVVVAVIAILIAMLLPALTKVRVRAKRLTELGDRKQVMMATLMYANDNTGYLPDRGTPSRAPHGLRYGARPNLNTTFVEPYLGEGVETRAQFMFCQSDLLQVRDPYGQDSSSYGPNHTAGGYNYGTLAFFNIPNPPGAGSWMTTPFDISSLRKAKPNNPVWSCAGFQKSNGIWFDHDRPLVYATPEGGNVVYMDGHGRWVRHEERIRWFNWYGPWYMPKDGL